MPPPRHLSPLNVPEILLNIGYYMPNPSLATCLQVNRYFHQTLEPLLFTELVLTQNKFRRPSPDVLQSVPRQLLRHVRHLSLSYYISVNYLCLDFRHLTSISLQGFIGRGCCDDFDFSDDEEEPSQVGGDREIMDALQTLIYKNPGLRRWNLHQPILQLTSNVWRAIAALTETQAFQEEITTTTMTTTKTISPQLDVINISNTTIDLESIPLFLAACRATKKLKVAACTFQGLRNHHTNQLRAPPVYGHGNDGPYVPQIVHFKDIIGLSVLSQLEFLARCPDVQEIRWQSTIRPKAGMKVYRWLDGGGDRKSMNHPLPTMEDFRRFIQSGTWMHLRSLVVRGIFDQYKHRILVFIPDEGFAHILETIPAQQLVKLECRGTAFGPLGLHALKRHCESLEKLVVKWSSNFTSALVQEALESFPNVTCLRVDRLAYEDIERGGPWVCLGLKALLVPFDMGVAIDLEDKQRRHRLVFDRISTLVRLVRLAINYDGTECSPRLQFTTSYGLGALSTLTNLSFLDVFESCQRLEMADVLWMVKKWPKLRTVEGDLHPDNHEDHMLQKYLHDHIGTTETQQ